MKFQGACFFKISECVTPFFLFVFYCLGCYGVSGEEAELDKWLCARCEADAMTEVS